MNRRQPGLVDDLNTLDIEGRHNFRLGANQIVYGGGYRFYHSRYDVNLSPAPPLFFLLSPAIENVHLVNFFAEDSIALRPSLTLTIGSKFEYSTFSGIEVMPSVRLAWQVAPDHLLWGAVSRAVRTPSILDRDIQSNVPLVERSGGSFGSESVIAYELGYRGTLSERAHLSATVYDDVYSDLRVIESDPSSGQFVFGNAQHGNVIGMESWGDYQITPRWRLMAGLNLLRKNLTLTDNATTLALVQHQGTDPQYQMFLRSYFNITPDLEFDVTVRRVDSLDFKSAVVPTYTGLDIHVGWHATDRVELALVGQNLVAPDHVESGYIGNASNGTVPRSVYASVSVKF